MNADLEKRLVAALSDDLTADALGELIAQTGAAITTAEADAAAARDAAFDPSRSSNLQVAQREMENAQLAHGRLLTLLPRLKARHAERIDREARLRFADDYAAVKARRDDLAAEFRKRYPALVAELAGLFADMKRIDQDCERINSAASAIPNERRRLLGCELTARGLQQFSGEAPSILTAPDHHARLPLFDGSARMAWPPPRRSLAADYFGGIVPMGDPHATSDQWHEHLRAANAEKAAIAERRVAGEAALQTANLRAYERSLTERDRAGPSSSAG